MGMGNFVAAHEPAFSGAAGGGAGTLGRDTVCRRADYSFAVPVFPAPLFEDTHSQLTTSQVSPCCTQFSAVQSQPEVPVVPVLPVPL